MAEANPKRTPGARRVPLRTWLKAGVVLALLLAALAYGAMRFPNQILTKDSGEVKADVLVVMGGAWLERPQRAAELFKHGDAPKVLVTGAGDCQISRQLLEKYGVPETAIILETQAHTTRENVAYSLPMLRQMGAHRVIIVTSWFHSRRALACFEHYAPDITFYSRPTYFGFALTDDNRRYIIHSIKTEYVKLLGYWVFYGVCPL